MANLLSEIEVILLYRPICTFRRFYEEAAPLADGPHQKESMPTQH